MIYPTEKLAQIINNAQIGTVSDIKSVHITFPAKALFVYVKTTNGEYIIPSHSVKLSFYDENNKYTSKTVFSSFEVYEADELVNAYKTASSDRQKNEFATHTPIPMKTPSPTTKPTAELTAEPTVKPTTEPTTAPTEAPKKTISVTTTNGEIEITAEDKRVEFIDVKPFVDEANRTQMPIRVLAEMLGFNVNWNDNTKTATLENDENTITIKIGENTINKNNETITMDTTAKVINDRTYIPLRAISEALGYVVEWK